MYLGTYASTWSSEFSKKKTFQRRKIYLSAFQQTLHQKTEGEGPAGSYGLCMDMDFFQVKISNIGKYIQSRCCAKVL